MKIVTIVSLLLVVGLLPITSFASDKPGIQDAEQLRFYTDFAAFQNLLDDSTTYQEIYVSFGNYQLLYILRNEKYLGGYKISFVIKDSLDNQLAKKEWENYNQIDSLKQAEELTSLEVTAFLLKPGDYILYIELTDLNSKATGLAKIPLAVPYFQPEKMQMSEIELARNITRSNVSNKFVKNKIEVLPNPSRVFGIESPFLYFYAELYNLVAQPGATDTLMKKYQVIDSRGNVVKDVKKTIKLKSSSSVWVEKINLIDLVTGNYTLKLNLNNLSTSEATEKQVDFWVNNPYKTVSLSQYSAEDIKVFRDQITYLVDPKELELFDQLNDRAKLQYINDFWRNQSPEFRSEHLKRFYTVQERFGSPTMPGWKSDRGRVFIMYGPPDEIDREPAGLDTRAYEVWIYETLKKQGRVEFVFVDLGIYGNYKLVHSTLRSGQRTEIYNPDWYREIKIAR